MTFRSSLFEVIVESSVGLMEGLGIHQNSGSREERHSVAQPFFHEIVWRTHQRKTPALPSSHGQSELLLFDNG
jgi:hypothetical protein